MTDPTDIDALKLGERSGLPDALRVLVEAYPRASWEGHKHFGELVRFWMQRHEMFRQLTGAMQQDAERIIAQDMERPDYLSRLSRLGGMLLNELHAHHQIEDHHYFPQLVALDPRVARGFDLLEADHDAMDELLHGLASGANTVLGGGEVAVFADHLADFDRLLQRHLTDEEEIVVPVILHSGFDG